MKKIFKPHEGKLVEVTEPLPTSILFYFKPNEKEVEEISREYKISKDEIVSLQDPYELPSFEKEKGYSFCVFIVPVKTNREVETRPLGILLKDRQVVLISYFKEIGKDYLPSNIDFFLPNFLERVAKEYSKLIEELGRKMYEIQESIRTTTTNERLFDLFLINKALTYILTSIKSNLGIIRKIEESAPELLNGKITDIIEEFEQAISLAEVRLNVLSGMIGTSASIISNNISQIMRVLTAVTIVLTIPTLVSTIYGMNVLLPLQLNPSAFYILLGISFLLSGLVYLFFRLKGIL